MQLKVVEKPGFDSSVFPFKTVFSLVPLIERFWENQAQAIVDSFGKDLRLQSDERNAPVSDFARQLKQRLAQASELLQPITDRSVIEKHRDIVDALMSTVFPAATSHYDMYAAIKPFIFESFYETPPMKQLLLFEGDNLLNNISMKIDGFNAGRNLFAYLAIMKFAYNVDIHHEYPMIYNWKDPKTGLDRYHRIRIFPHFCDIKVNGEIPPLAEEKKNKLLNNLLDESTWREVINPEQFEFHGFLILNAIDVTPQEVISSLKYDLIDKDSIISPDKFNKLQHKLRSLLKKPDLRLGLVALGDKNSLDLHDHVKLVKSFVLSQSCIDSCSSCAGTVYDKLMNTKEIIYIRDLKKYTGCTPVELGIAEQGIRNLVLAPLEYNDELIGIMELGSPHEGDLNEINSMLLREVLPLFAMCVKRSMDDFNGQIQAIIKEKCTAVHPSVEWRFRKAAADFINKQQRDVYAEMEEIVFENVYPLYGESDIRDSSLHRNRAIQEDLQQNLKMAQEVIELSAKFKPMAILDELNYKINKQLRSLQRGLSSGDESTVVNFLHEKVFPLFEHLEGFNPEVKKLIEKYKTAVDPKLGFLYSKRKDFEESVNLINETIAAYLDSEEEKTQELFPHYFEKYKTDGVEHGIYMGASLVEDGKFSPMYLKNLRLWQLMTICGIERKVQSVRPHLRVPLETAHLVLVQNSPLSIKFHYDEKKFDVDGTYNIRYEVMKKRIDKAEVKGKTERLTQPGMIAIVYSHDSEAAEYREYIEYLQSKDFLMHEIEELELKELQGVRGLKALRVKVNAKSGETPSDVLLIEAEKLINSPLAKGD
jgi:hypothetical protein